MNDNDYVSELKEKWAACDLVLTLMAKKINDAPITYDYYEGVVNDQETCKWIDAFIAPIRVVSCSIDNKYSLNTSELSNCRVHICNLLEQLYDTFDPCNGNSKSRLSHADLIECCYDLASAMGSIVNIIVNLVRCVNNPDNRDDPLMTLVKLQVQSAKNFISKHYSASAPGFVTHRIIELINGL